jgi:hypothetical protein
MSKNLKMKQSFAVPVAGSSLRQEIFRNETLYRAEDTIGK